MTTLGPPVQIWPYRRVPIGKQHPSSAVQRRLSTGPSFKLMGLWSVWFVSISTMAESPTWIRRYSIAFKASLGHSWGPGLPSGRTVTVLPAQHIPASSEEEDARLQRLMNSLAQGYGSL